MNNQEQKSIRETVLNEIKSGGIKMRSKMYFILKTVLIILGITIIGLFILYLVSFIIFSTRASGVWFLPRFGFVAMGVFFRSLPWLLILIAVIFIILLELFVKRFAFVYRRPVLYSVAGIIILTILGSFMIFRTNVHSDIFWMARKGSMPFPMTGEFYRGFGAPKLSNIHYGIVSGVSDKGFSLETQRGEILTIMVASTTRFSLIGEIKKGDRMLVLGKRNDGTVEAFDVRRIEDEFDIFKRRPSGPSPFR